MKPIRILHVVTYMGRGGLETMLMNYYRHIDRSKVQFDFLVHRDFEADYDKEIKELGGYIYHVPAVNPFSSLYHKSENEFFQKHPYSIVHSHLDCMSGYPLKHAKNAGVPVRIAHAHSKNQDKDLKYPIKIISKAFIARYATNLFACGQDAGKWMFNGNQFSVLRNAIDVQKYVYSPEIRQEIRQEFNIANQIVLGHVGRFNPPKNHNFLIDIFYEYQKENPNSILMLVGDGSGKQEIEKKAENLGIREKIIFTGVRSDVNRLLQAMDVFVFPSLYEGLPVTMIEAQSAGLSCVISDQVPRECIVTDLVKQQASSDSVWEWIKTIDELKNVKREDQSKAIKAAGYDIKENAEKLQEFYLKVYRENE